VTVLDHRKINNGLKPSTTVGFVERQQRAALDGAS
jgi:hypothetical protein